MLKPSDKEAGNAKQMGYCRDEGVIFDSIWIQPTPDLQFYQHRHQRADHRA